MRNEINLIYKIYLYLFVINIIFNKIFKDEYVKIIISNKKNPAVCGTFLFI